MSWSEDDWGKPIFPTRFGSPQGHATERKMLDALGEADSFRTRIRNNPDGSQTVLRTKGGAPRFTTTVVVQQPITAKVTSYFLHGVEVPMVVGAFFTPGGAISDINSVVKYPTFYGAGFVDRLDHTKTEHFSTLNFATKWVSATTTVAHSGWDGSHVYLGGGTDGLHLLSTTTSPTAVLSYAVPGSIGICYSWSYMTSGDTGNASAMMSLLYADGYPYEADAQAQIKGVAGNYSPVAAFSRGGETFCVALNLSTCGAAVQESQFNLNKGLPSSVETTYSTIYSVDGTTPPVPITLPSLPARGFFRFTDSGGAVITPLFQSYGAHPRWFEVNKSGTKGLTVTRGGYYSQTLHGIRDFAHAGMLGEVDLVTGAMTHFPVDSVYHRKYTTFITRDSFSDGNTLPANATRYQYDIIRAGFDANDTPVILSQGAKFVSDSNNLVTSTTVFAAFLDGVSLIRLADTEATDSAIQPLYVNFDENLFLFCVCKRQNNYTYNVDLEFVLIKNGVVLLTWSVSRVRVQWYDPEEYTVVQSNTATTAYVVAGDSSVPLTGVVAVCEPYFERVTPANNYDAAVEIYCLDVVTGSYTSGISLLTSGRESVAISRDKKRLAISIAAGALRNQFYQSATPIPCLNVVINLENNTTETFGEPFTFYNRLNFLDSLP